MLLREEVSVPARQDVVSSHLVGAVKRGGTSSSLKVLCRLEQRAESRKTPWGRLLPCYITNRPCDVWSRAQRHSDHHLPSPGQVCSRLHLSPHAPLSLPRRIPAGPGWLWRASVTSLTLTARGARYLNPIPCSLLWRLMVYSLVTTSPMAVPLFSLLGGILIV